MLVTRYQILGEHNYGEIFAANREDAGVKFAAQTGETRYRVFPYGAAPRALSLKEFEEIERLYSDSDERDLYAHVRILDMAVARILFDNEDYDRWDLLIANPKLESNNNDV